MNLTEDEIKRLDLKEKLNHILEPLIIDTLVVMPSNPIKFMREWLEKRQHIYENANILLQYSEGLKNRKQNET
jgi:hypothetical protein